MKRLVIGMSGSSGVIYGIRMLEALAQDPEVETHLILSQAAKMNIGIETQWSVADVEALADEVHNNKNIGASIASGSYKTAGMIVVPCSMKTLSGHRKFLRRKSYYPRRRCHVKRASPTGHCSPRVAAAYRPLRTNAKS